MEIRAGLCQLVSQGNGSYRYLDWGWNNGSVYMSNDSNRLGTYWLLRNSESESGSWILEKPSLVGYLTGLPAGSGDYLVTRMENPQWYPNPKPYIAISNDITWVPWSAETYGSAPGCFNFRRDGYLNGNPGDTTTWGSQVSLASHPDMYDTSWKLLYGERLPPGLIIA